MTGLPRAYSFKLQATLSASSATIESVHGPHHPICCDSETLTYDEDGRFSCGHVTVPPDDPRTHHCLDHSIALLLIELALDR